jgi:predicted nucleic acid-binding protein
MTANSRRGQLLVGRSLFAKAVLVDTGAFLALANPSDHYHYPAVECLNSIASHRLPLFASIPTLYECYSRFLFDLGRNQAANFLASVFGGSINLVRTIEEDELKAQELIQRYQAVELSLVDAANMAIMLRLGIATCFSFDSDFLQVGFIRIPPFHL